MPCQHGRSKDHTGSAEPPIIPSSSPLQQQRAKKKRKKHTAAVTGFVQLMKRLEAASAASTCHRVLRSFSTSQKEVCKFTLTHAGAQE